MSKLEPPDCHYLNAAHGWVELGNPAEAKLELQNISAALQQHPAVLLAKWEILAKEGKWDLALDVAKDVVERAPEWPDGWVKRSFSLHEMRRTQEAYDELSEASRRFPKLSIVPYNLACYACQLGMEKDAQRWFSRALKLGDPKEIKTMALSDPDLKPMKEFIEGV